MFTLNWPKRAPSLMIVAVGLVLASCYSAPTSPSTAVAAPPATQAPPTVAAPQPTKAPPTAVGPIGKVIIASGQDASTLDPLRVTTVMPEINIVYHVFDPLVWQDDNMQFQPGLAKSWEMLNDTTWQFNLRQNVKFHNGELVDAAAVKFTFDRALNPASKSTFPWLGMIQLDKVEVVDTYTVKLITKAPAPSMLFVLSQFVILPPKYYGENSLEAVNGKPIGSGPYKFVEWVKNDHVTLEAQPDHWQGAPAIKTLTFRIIPEMSTSLAELQSGGIDIASNVPPDLAATVKTATTRLEGISSGGHMVIGIHITKGSPLANTRVRQALNYAVDVNSIAKNLLGGYNQRAFTLVGSESLSPNIKPWPYDPEKAKQLLTEAGYPSGFKITLDTPVGRYTKDKEVAQAVADYLTKVGVVTTVKPVEWTTYVTQMLMTKKTDDLFLIGMGVNHEPLVDVGNLSYNFPFNPTEWNNPDFESLLGKAATTMDEKKRLGLLHQAQEIANNESPQIWMYFMYDMYGVSNRLNWKPRGDTRVFLRQATLKP